MSVVDMALRLLWGMSVSGMPRLNVGGVGWVCENFLDGWHKNICFIACFS